MADKQQDVVELDLPGVKKLFLGLERRIQVGEGEGLVGGRGRVTRGQARPRHALDAPSLAALSFTPLTPLFFVSSPAQGKSIEARQVRRRAREIPGVRAGAL